MMKTSLLPSKCLLAALLWLSNTSSIVVSAAKEDATSFVFLQKFPLQGTFGKIFHTEVLVCPKEGFLANDQQFLEGKMDQLQDYVELDEAWWTDKTAACREFGYGGAACMERCCGSPQTDRQTHFPLNERRAVIGNADVSQKTLFLYGTSGSLTANQAYQTLCPPDKDHPSCWSNWAGTDYNPLTNNCNTYTSTLLHCVFKLSEKKPDLGPSDMITVTCDKCPAYKEPWHDVGSSNVRVN